jgi:hypothetical protein
VRDNLYKNITGGGGNEIGIGQRMRDRGFKHGLVDDFQVFNAELTGIEVAQLHDGAALTDLLGKAADDLSSEEKASLYAYYLARADDVYAKQLQTVRETRTKRSETVDGIREIMVMSDLPASQTRQSYLLKRGAYDAPGEKVSPDTPAALGSLPPGHRHDRLDMARWLTDPDHPLTARVAVNHFWQICFGQGLVRTPEDFGSQGELPTHPELLDWLAKDFIENGWDVKRLMKLLVTSTTYRQSSIAQRHHQARDPENRLLARAPRYRLPAEMIRDNALAASGLLVRSLGGAPARPYELEVSFKPIGRGKGATLYRRSLYTYWKRTGPAPVMMTLDASKREVCSVKRERTATPLQAMVLLNDPQLAEAARVMGERMSRRHGGNVDALVEEMFRCYTSRRPSVEEKDILMQLYAEQVEHFTGQPAAVAELLKSGDLAESTLPKNLTKERVAATAVLASTLMNLDDCVRKR